MGRAEGLARHPGLWSHVQSGVGMDGCAAGTSLALRVLFAQLETVGSGAPGFWRAFWVVLPQLTDDELLRVALATGARGRAYFRAITPLRAGR